MTTAVAGAATDEISGTRFDAALAGVTLLPWLGALVGLVAGVDLLAGVWVIVGLAATAHVGTTAGFYADPEMRTIMASDPLRYFLAPVVAIAGAVALLVLLPTGAVTVLLVGYGGWQIHHFTKQQYGVFAFWCRARRIDRPDDRERQLIQATTAIGLLAMPRLAPAIPEVISSVLGAVGLAVFAAVLFRWWLIRTEDQARNVAMLVAVVFYLPLYLGMPLGIAVLTYSWAHSAQYLLMMGQVARRGMWIAGVGGGLVVALATTLNESPVWFGLAIGMTVAHFVIDAGAWRLSEAPQRAYMKSRFSFL